MGWKVDPEHGLGTCANPEPISFLITVIARWFKIGDVKMWR
jgi:hypothetical protein